MPKMPKPYFFLLCTWNNAFLLAILARSWTELKNSFTMCFNPRSTKVLIMWCRLPESLPCGQRVSIAASCQMLHEGSDYSRECCFLWWSVQGVHIVKWMLYEHECSAIHCSSLLLLINCNFVVSIHFICIMLILLVTKLSLLFLLAFMLRNDCIPKMWRYASTDAYSEL